jgi:integrase
MKAGASTLSRLPPRLLCSPIWKTRTGVACLPSRQMTARFRERDSVALAAIGYKARMTGHGFRQLFSTLANESGLWRPDVIEAALAHKESDAVRLAYNKAAYLGERRRLMNWWCDELARIEAGAPAKVVPIKQSAI